MPSILSKRQPKPAEDDSQGVVHLILFKTLSLLALMNIELGNLPQAKQAIQDLEYISKDDANTYVLKIKVLILDQTSESTLIDAVHQMQSKPNFKFTHFLSVL